MQQRHGAVAPARTSSDEFSVGSIGSVGSKNGHTTVLGTGSTNNAPTAGTTDPQAAAGRQRRRTRRKAMSMTTATVEPSTSTSFNWVFTFLILGLFFCLMDAFYIMRFIMVRDRDEHVFNVAEATADTNQDNNFGNNFGNANDENHILKLLSEAGITNLDETVLAKLPSWSDVTALYGPAPVIAGWEKNSATCRAFQESGDAGDHFIATAGTFNTGTNLMAELLIANCHMPERMKKYGKKNRGVRWQVLWGKHTPVGDESFRQGHRTYNDSSLTADNIFPVVTVRDPFKWMQSMCRHAYGANWHHDEQHCPNLVPNQVEIDKGWILPDNADGSKNNTIPVSVKYVEFTRYHTSLVDFWNSWYQEYTKATFSKLIVRFEDLVFHPKQVTQAVCECAGGEMNQQPFHYIVDSAKKGDGAHGKERTSYVDALVKYGTEKGRYKGMTGEDLQFAKTNLDPALMKMFGYPYPSASIEAEVA